MNFADINNENDNLNFDIFELKKIELDYELSYLVVYLCEINNLFGECNVNSKVLYNFICQI